MKHTNIVVMERGEMMLSLKQGDCLKLMGDIPDKSIDLVLCDLPYGVTTCKWDIVIPFEKLWEQYNRVIKDKGAIVLFGTQPFSSLLVASNKKQFKHEWIWQKEQGVGFQVAKYRPMQEHEHILVFSGKSNRVSYYPIMEKSDKLITRRGCDSDKIKIQNSVCPIAYSEVKDRTYTHKYPKSILSFKRDKSKYHPTQKPIALLEYLIKTYSRDGDVVLDNCMGGGGTGIACLNTNRNFIGFELNEEYFKVAEERIKNHVPTT